MSDTEVEKVDQELEQVEDAVTEQQESAGADGAEGSPQESIEETIETISLNELVGETQTQNDSEQKEKNKLYAQNRVMARKLKQLEAQAEAGQLPPELAYKPSEDVEEPQLADFQARLYDDFEGDTNLMLAHFGEARRKFDGVGATAKAQQAQHNEKVLADVREQQARAESFVANVDKTRKLVPDIDDSLVKAEDMLGTQAFENIRNEVGENAPLVLAALGSNKQKFNELMELNQNGTVNQLVKFLTRLEDDILRKLPSKTVSKAQSETPLSGGTGSVIDYDAEIAKVFNDPKMRGMKGVHRVRELRAQRDAK